VSAEYRPPEGGLEPLPNTVSENGEPAGADRATIRATPSDGAIAMTSFQLVGIDPGPFEPLFALSDDQLAAIGAVRRTADASPGFPCRVSLEDADIGDELLLLPYVHQPATSPYHASGPIFVRRNAVQNAAGIGVVPPYVAIRLISVRASATDDMMVAASVCDGAALAGDIAMHFANAGVAYLHLHNAKRGCFACRVNRATAA
jgi:Protein of unknown function (DUF1203)